MKPTSSLLLLAALAQSQITQQPLTSLKPLALENIPSLGFGTWNLKEKNTSEAVSWAIQVGYRHIDCAEIYGNEAEVGRGILDGLEKTGLKREEIWVTSKLWNTHHGPELVELALKNTLSNLGVGYLDLYHMHWPVASTHGHNSIEYRETWEAMGRLPQTGGTRYIGVSNFNPYQLSDLLNHTLFVPAVHQMEMHPHLQQNDFLDWHNKHNIRVTAYSPLAGTNPTYDESDSPVPLLKSKELAKIAKKRSCTPAQVSLAWGMSRGVSVIPKSIHQDYITENFGSLECELKKQDLRKIDALEKYHHRYNNPAKAWGVPLYSGLEDATGKHDKAKFGEGE